MQVCSGSGFTASQLVRHARSFRSYSGWSRKLFNGTSRASYPPCRTALHLTTSPFTVCSISKHINQQKPASTITHTRHFHHSPAMAHRAYIALGSNLGDRVAAIEAACRNMEATGHIKVLRTSSLWETRAMYVLDQDKFVNGVCEVGSVDQPRFHVLTRR
jgi:hypothetical protein